MKIWPELHPVWFTFGASLIHHSASIYSSEASSICFWSRVPCWMTTVPSGAQTNAILSFINFSSPVSAWYHFESGLPTEGCVQLHGLPDVAVPGALCMRLSSLGGVLWQGDPDHAFRGTAPCLPGSGHLLSSSERMIQKLNYMIITSTHSQPLFAGDILNNAQFSFENHYFCFIQKLLMELCWGGKIALNNI